MRKALFVAALLLAGALPVSADQAPAAPSANATLGALRKAQEANAYRKLFEVRESLQSAVAEASKNAAPAPKKTIVCGLTIIEADPFFDQKMKVTPPKDPNVRYTIRAVEPSLCTPQ